jgi:hypothetical protein
MDQRMKLSTVNVALSALAQMFLKLGITANGVQASLRSKAQALRYIMS